MDKQPPTKISGHRPEGSQVFLFEWELFPTRQGPCLILIKCVGIVRIPVVGMSKEHQLL